MVRLSFITVLIIFYCCKNSKLIINRGNYEESPPLFKTNGLYYKRGDTPYEGKTVARVFFFYRNGLLYGGSYFDFPILSSHIYEYRTHQRETPTDWGIYNIQKNNILEFEKWEPSSGGGAKTNIYTAEILNDTTFVIKKIFSHYDKKTFTAQDTFHFMPYSPKPDSTNRFIKE